MFNLEKEIKKWLKSFQKQRAFDEGMLQEMEAHLRDHIEDLIAQGLSEREAFYSAVKEFGEVPNVAKEEFWNQQRKPTIKSIIYGSLLKNFYSVALRNLIKHKAYFAINILGLSVGIAGFIFISLYVVNELNYDRFHANYENIYAVATQASIRGERNHDARSSNPLANTLLQEYPQVEETTRILKSGPILIGKADNQISEKGVLFVDERFLRVFDFKLLKGMPKVVLKEPRSLILTESYSKKYFGDTDPIGEELLVGANGTSYKITGVIEDSPANSHIKFDILGSISSNDAWNTSHWIGGKQYTYAAINGQTDISKLESEMKELFYKYMAPEIEYFTGMSIEEWEEGNSVGYKLTPIKDIHLKSTFTAGELEPSGNISYIYIYSLIGVLILLMAIFNFINLATAYSATRAKEVGVRKVIGSSKSNLISQFVLESIFIAFLATLGAAVIVIAGTQDFIDLIGKDLAFKLTDHLANGLLLVGLALLVGLLAGLYPAFILSSFKPVEVLKGRVRSGVKSGWLRNTLVTMQFCVAIVIIIGTTITYEQIKFMLDKSLGFDKEQVLVIERPDWLGTNLDTFKEEINAQSAVLAASNSLTLPGKRFEIRSYRKKEEQEVFLLLNNQVSYDYLDVMGLELVSGRFFSKEFSADSNAVVINESAAAAFGFEDPIGKPLKSAFKKGRPLTIIGVVKDYNVESLHKSIGAISLELDNSSVGYLSLKVAGSQNIRETISSIEDTWHKHANDKPFQYFFFDEDYENLYNTESTTGRVLLVFASLSILIACLGLIGLITFTTTVRTRELGIRKVLGAGSGTLIKLLSKETLNLIGLATIIGWLLAYFASEYWLQNFADRIQMNVWIYLLPTCALVLIVGLTISFQTIKAATGNPVDSLRQD